MIKPLSQLTSVTLFDTPLAFAKDQTGESAIDSVLEKVIPENSLPEKTIVKIFNSIKSRIFKTYKIYKKTNGEC